MGTSKNSLKTCWLRYKHPQNAHLLTCKLGFGFLRRSNPNIHVVVRFFARLHPAIIDLIEFLEVPI